MQEWNTQLGKLILSAYQVFLKLFNCIAGREFQIFRFLSKKKCFISFDLKRLSMILKPLLWIEVMRSLAT